MALPVGVTTAFVTLKAPVAFTGMPGKVYLELKPNVRLVHAASGTTLADWMTTMKADENGTISVLLPHTDQTGFLDESGAPVLNWSYTANIRYDLSGQVVSTLPKVFSLVSSITSMDLATLPVGAPVDWEVGAFGVVTSVNGETGAVTFTKDDFGLSNVDNTSDVNKPISNAVQAALNNKMAASVTYVASVNTRTGAVTLSKSDVGLANVDNTSDVNKPISTAVQAALDTKASNASAGVSSVNTRTGAVVLAKADVGLSNVDNTTDANKPVSSATQTALNDKMSVTKLPLNVKEFGAIGDGVADDTVAIQAALDAVPVGGRAVYIPSGRYKVTGTLQIKQDGTMLYGDGAANRVGATQDARGSRLEASGGITGSILLVQRAANDRPLSGITLRDFTITGELVGTAVDAIIFRASQSYIHKVHIWDASGNGLKLMGYSAPAWDTYDTVVSEVLIGRCLGNGVLLAGDTADLHFSHCVFLTNLENMQITGGASAQVTGCHFYDPTQRNIFFNGSGSRSRFSNCKIEGARQHQVQIDSTVGGYSDIAFVGCGFSSLSESTTTNTWDYVHISGPSGTGIARTTLIGNSFNQKGGRTIKARYAVNIATTGAQHTVVLANVFGAASHWGTTALNNATNSTLLTTIRGNAGVGDVKNWRAMTSSLALDITDADGIVEVNSASAITVTIPTVAAVPFVKGTMVEVFRQGTGTVTIVGDTGVTVRTPSTNTLRAQYSTVKLRMRAPNEWVLDGDLT